MAEVGDWKTFSSGRSLTAWIGLVPRQHSSGGKERLRQDLEAGQSTLTQPGRARLAEAVAAFRKALTKRTREPTRPVSLDRLAADHSITRPRWAARATASVRLSASSLARIAATWNLAVESEIPSRRAITLLEAPSAMAASTSCSRGVSETWLAPSSRRDSSDVGELASSSRSRTSRGRSVRPRLATSIAVAISVLADQGGRMALAPA